MKKIMIGLMIIMLVGIVAAGCNVHSKWAKLKVTYPGGERYIDLYDGQDDVEWVVYNSYGYPRRLAIQLDNINVDTDSDCNVINEDVSLNFTILDTSHFDDLYTHEILEMGRKIYVGDKYSLKLTDIGVAEEHGGEEMHAALFDVINERAAEIETSSRYNTFEKMFPGDREEFYYYKYDPKVYLIEVNKTAYGYELFQRWAEVKVYSPDSDEFNTVRWTGREGESTVINGATVEVVGIYETVTEEEECTHRKPDIDVEEESKDVEPGDSFYYHFTIENRDQDCDPSDLRVRITDYDGCLDFDWYSEEYTLDSGEDKRKRVEVENVRSCSSGTHRVKFEVCANGYCDRDYVDYTIKQMCTHKTSYSAIEYPKEQPLVFHEYTGGWVWVLGITNKDHGDCSDKTYTISVEPTAETVRHFNVYPKLQRITLSKNEDNKLKINITKNNDNPPKEGELYYIKVRIENSVGNVKNYDIYLKYEGPAQPVYNYSLKNVKVYRGWNIIPFIQGMNVSTDCGLKPYAYVYDPFYNQYITIATSGQSSNPYYNSAIDRRYGPLNHMNYRVAYSGAWAYSPEDCKMNISYNVEPGSDSEPMLTKGWNFVQVADWMTNKWWSQVTGSCEITKVYSWNPLIQRWEGPAPDDFYISSDKHGEVLVVYTTSECRLGLVSGGGNEQPPTLP